jgi:trans-aconitate methyltransferase
MPDVQEYRSLLSRTPFRDTRVWAEDADQYFASAEAMIGWIDQPSIVPFLQHLDEQTGPRFRDRLVESMLKQTRQADGRYCQTFRRINVFARK